MSFQSASQISQSDPTSQFGQSVQSGLESNHTKIRPMNPLVIVIIVLVIVILAIGAVTVWLATKPASTGPVCSNVQQAPGVTCTTANNITTCAPNVNAYVVVGDNGQLKPAPASCVAPGQQDLNGVCSDSGSLTCGNGTKPGTGADSNTCVVNLGATATIDPTGLVVASAGACGTGTTPGADHVCTATTPGTTCIQPGAAVKLDPQTNTYVPASPACGTGTTYNGSPSFTCTATGPGTSCPTLLAGVKKVANTVVPDFVDSTLFTIDAQHQIEPAQTVCPTGSKLDPKTFTCSAPTANCPKLGTNVVNTNNTIVPAQTVCPNGSTLDPTKFTCSAASVKTYDPNDPQTWVMIDNENTCRGTSYMSGSSFCAVVPVNLVGESYYYHNYAFVSGAPNLNNITKAQQALTGTISSDTTWGGVSEFCKTTDCIGIDVFYDSSNNTSYYLPCQFDANRETKDGKASMLQDTAVPGVKWFNSANTNTATQLHYGAVVSKNFDINNPDLPKPKQSLGKTAAKRKLPGWD